MTATAEEKIKYIDRELDGYFEFGKKEIINIYNKNDYEEVDRISLIRTAENIANEMTNGRENINLVSISQYLGALSGIGEKYFQYGNLNRRAKKIYADIQKEHRKVVKYGRNSRKGKEAESAVMAIIISGADEIREVLKVLEYDEKSYREGMLKPFTEDAYVKQFYEKPPLASDKKNESWY